MFFSISGVYKSYIVMVDYITTLCFVSSDEKSKSVNLNRELSSLTIIGCVKM